MEGHTLKTYPENMATTSYEQFCVIRLQDQVSQQQKSHIIYQVEFYLDCH